jgi:hypothetical protein
VLASHPAEAMDVLVFELSSMRARDKAIFFASRRSIASQVLRIVVGRFLKIEGLLLTRSNRLRHRFQLRSRVQPILRIG